MSNTFLLIAAGAAAILLAWWKYTQTHIAERPLEIRWYRLNGISALVTNESFKNARKAVGYKIPTEIYIAADRPIPNLPGALRNATSLFNSVISTVNSKKDSSLFVPGISESLVSFAKQNEIRFLGNPELHERLQLQSKSYRARYWKWVRKFFDHHPKRLDRGYGWITTALLVCIVFPLGLLIQPSFQSYVNEPEVHHLATFTNGQLETLKLPKFDWPEMKNEHKDNKQNFVLKAIIISEPREVGGDQVVFKIRTEKTGELQGGGFAAKSLGLQKGNIVYFRWADPLFEGMYGQGMRWVITEAEARELLAEGYRLTNNLDWRVLWLFINDRADLFINQSALFVLPYYFFISTLIFAWKRGMVLCQEGERVMSTRSTSGRESISSLTSSFDLPAIFGRMSPMSKS